MGSNRNGRKRYERNEKRVRDAAIFLVGIAGAVNELWFVPDPRPYALAFLASLLGLPFILRADASRRSRDDENDGDEASSKKRSER